MQTVHPKSMVTTMLKSKMNVNLGVVSTATGAVLMFVAPVHAASFSITNVTGTWDSIQGTSSFSGEGTSQVRWGIAGTSAGQSGFNFDANSVLDTIFDGSNFILGKLTHLNFPIYSPSSGVDFKLSMGIDGASTSFDYSFSINETPNSGECESFQISNTFCDDQITFTSGLNQSIFSKDGLNYTLELLGFSKTLNGLSPVSSFVTEENKDSSAFLVARIVKNEDNSEVSTPEPVSLFSLCAIGGFAIFTKRRNS